MRAAFHLLRHALLLWRAGQVRFRLETFGLYYPAVPYAAPWWRISPRIAWLLTRQVRSYACWLLTMEQMRHKGAASWWTQHALGKGIPHEWPY